MIYRCAVAIVCIIIFISACKKNSPSSSDFFIQAHKQTVSLKGSGVSFDTIHITSNAAWSIAIEADGAWISATPSSGNGNGDIIISSASSNASSTLRTGNIEVKTTEGSGSVIITVIQFPGIQTLLTAAFGGEGFDSFNDYITTPDGGYIAVGHTTSTEGDVTGAHGNKDVWIVKFASDGTKQWHQLYGGEGNDMANSIVRTTSGNYLILGASNSMNDDVSANKGDMDAWLISMDADGNLLWEKSMGGTNEDWLFNLKTGGNGTYLMAGWTKSNDHDVTSNHGAKDAWLVKINEQGAILWEKTFGGTNEDYALDATPVSDGGTLFCGQVVSNDGDASDRPSAGHTAWLVKLNTAGNIAGKLYIGTSENDVGRVALEAANGDYLFCGTTNTDGAFDGYNGERDAFVCRVDPSGNFLWKKAYGGSLRDEPSGLIEATNGTFVFAGVTSSDDGDIQHLLGGEDAWVMNIDGGGNVLSGATFGGNLDDNIYRVKKLSNDRFAFVGHSRTLEDAYPDLDDVTTAWFEVFSF
jgi:hypothetical protein